MYTLVQKSHTNYGRKNNTKFLLKLYSEEVHKNITINQDYVSNQGTDNEWAPPQSCRSVRSPSTVNHRNKQYHESLSNRDWETHQDTNNKPIYHYTSQILKTKMCKTNY